jgi:hypothetical protein
MQSPKALLIACPVVGLLLFSTCLGFYWEAGRHLTPKSVSVQGYYRRDGSYVQPYHRRPPGGVKHDAPYGNIRSNCGMGMLTAGGIAFAPFYCRRKATLPSESSHGARTGTRLNS